MPLHDLSYQRFDGARTSRAERIVAIARTTITQLVKRRAFLMLLSICWIPVIVRAVLIYVSRQFPQVAVAMTVDAQLWRQFLEQQIILLPVLLIALYTGASAIASDFASGAIVIYLSKPISRLDYCIGKALPVMSALLVVTLVPAFALLIVQLSLAEDFALLKESPFLPVSVLLYSLWICLFFTIVVLAVSSLTRSGRVAGAGFFALVLGSKMVFFVALTQLRLNDPPAFLSLMDAPADAGYLFFGNLAGGDAPALSMASMATVMALAILVLRRRLTAAEVAS